MPNNLFKVGDLVLVAADPGVGIIIGLSSPQEDHWQWGEGMLAHGPYVVNLGATIRGFAADDLSHVNWSREALQKIWDAVWRV